MKSSITNLITVATGTAKNIPITPKYAPPSVTANITSNWLISSESPTILGFIMFASICCSITTTTVINKAFPIPPVNIVISIAITTATIAPKYGIRLNSPIIKPNSTAYFTCSIDNATDTNTPTNIASSTWLVRNLKNTLFDFMKYFFIFSYAFSEATAFVNLDKNLIIAFLCANMYTETITAMNASSIVSIALMKLLIYC